MRRVLTDKEIIIQSYNIWEYKTLGCKIPISKALFDKYIKTAEVGK